MRNKMLERLNWRQCLQTLRNIYEASWLVFICTNELITLTVRIEKNYYMSYIGADNLTYMKGMVQ